MKKWFIPILSILALSAAFYFLVYRNDDDAAVLVEPGYKVTAATFEKIASSNMLKSKGTPINGLDVSGITYEIATATELAKIDRVNAWFKGVNVYPTSAALKLFKVEIEDYINSDQAKSFMTIEIGELLP